MKPAEAQELVAMLVTAFPGSMAKLSDDQQRATQKLYRDMLSDLEHDCAKAAVTSIIATHRYPTMLPTVAEIRESVLVMSTGPKRSGVDAWGEVRAAVGRFGMNRTPTFADPITARVMEQLGWREFCQSDANETSSWRARFVELYDHLTADYRKDALTRSLPAVKRANELRAAEQAKPVGQLIAGLFRAEEDAS